MGPGGIVDWDWIDFDPTAVGIGLVYLQNIGIYYCLFVNKAVFIAVPC